MGTFIAADAIASGKLKIVLADYAAPGPLASVVYLPSRHLSPRVRTFVDFLADCIPPEPVWDRLLAGPTKTLAATKQSAEQVGS